MGTPWDGRTDLERFAKRIQALEDAVKALQAAGAAVPFTDVDPSPIFGNLWAMNDNRIRLRKPDGTIREIVTTAPGATTTGTPLPAVPAAPKTLQGVWSAAWTQTYKQNGGQRPETALHVGYGDGYNGIQTCLIGWPYATIASALAGSVVTAVDIYLYCTHCWWNSGSDVGFASHNNTSKPTNLGGVTTGLVSSTHIRGTDQGGVQGWHGISTVFGAWLRDGSSTGCTLTAPSGNASYYSVLAGVGSGLPVPQLRITYVK